MEDKVAKELALVLKQKEKIAAELLKANKELVFQNEEKEKRASELVLANKELLFQNKEKEKRAAELAIANAELAFQNGEKVQHAAELAVANTELTFQNLEKEKRAYELGVANAELAFQNNEKRQRASELVIANKELTFQNIEKEKRASELLRANAELAFQNNEKAQRAAELAIANKELVFQYEEKRKRAEELVIANEELAFQNEEKEKRAAELVNANMELAFQISEKEKRGQELLTMNKELESFTFISSHDLQEPLRKIQVFASRILSDDYKNLSDAGKNFFERMQVSALHMQTLINDLLAYSRTTSVEGKFEPTDLNKVFDEFNDEYQEEFQEKNAKIIVGKLFTVKIIPFQFRQLLYNLISNSIKFSRPGHIPKIVIKAKMVTISKDSEISLPKGKKYCLLTITDNGIGFEPEHSERIFEIFQRLNAKEDYAGTGMGLTIVKKIVENHNGAVTAIGEIGKGATFNIYLPA